MFCTRTAVENDKFANGKSEMVYFIQTLSNIQGYGM